MGRAELRHSALAAEAGRRPDHPVAELLRWAERQEGVAGLLHDPDEGVLVVRYDDRRTPGALLKAALVDRLRALVSEHADKAARRLAIRVAHELPGRVRLRVDNAPAAAIGRLASFLASLPHVDSARASPATSTVLVSFDPGKTSSAALIDELKRTPVSGWPAAQPEIRPAWIEWAKTGLSAGVMAAAVTGAVPSAAMLGAVALTAMPSFSRALSSLAKGRINVDVMDATAIGVCLARGEPIAASVITALLALGDLILDRTGARARTTIARLMDVDGGEAFVLAGDRIKRIHPRELKPGMRVCVYSGGRIPADGRIVEGSLAVDEKALTGESVPRERETGDAVMAASVVVAGQAVLEVERAGGDTVAARIVRILEGAGDKPMTLQRNAERYADRLVLPTFATAGLAFALSGALDRLTSVLITDFGTGVRVAVPTAALAAMTMGARAGVLIKGATFLERLSEADTVVFDKTGTLTLGEPEVTEVVTLSPDLGPRELCAFAAAAEANQSHPIAGAIARHAAAIGAPAWQAAAASETYRVGLGLRAEVRGRQVWAGSARMMRCAGIDAAPGNRAQERFAAAGASSVYVAIDGRLAGVIGYADAPRPESAQVVRALRAGGRRRVLLLSGDARAPAEAIARQVGIDETIAEVLPEQKSDVVRTLRREGRKVAMVGDGTNDAPALAAADVGVSLHGGTDVALETADVVLLEGGLARLPEIFQLADDSMARVKRVLGVVLVPNALAIAAGALGLIDPVAAAVINNGSTIAAAAHAVAPLFRRR